MSKPNDAAGLEAPKAGDDIRGYGPFFEAVVQLINRSWTVKPKGKVIATWDKVVIDLTGLVEATANKRARFLAENDGVVSVETIAFTGETV